MDIKAIVERIDQRLAELKISPRRASIDSGLSTDGIRNLRRAAESGRPGGAHARTLNQLAIGLQTNIAWLMDGTGSPDDRDPAPATSPGRPAGQSIAPVPAAAIERIRAIADAFGMRPGTDLWQVKDASMQLAGYLPGDFMLVRQLSEASEREIVPGETVVAQVLDRDQGVTETIVRRFHPPFLLPASLDPTVLPVLEVDAHLRGKVVASWRIPEPAA